MSHPLTMTNEELVKCLENLDSLTIVGPLAKSLPANLSNPTLFIDGGVNLIEDPLPVDIICVGDGDSAPSKDMNLLLPQDKDISDLGFALENLPPSIRNIELSGFFGQRLDHQLSNLGEIHSYVLKSKCFIKIDEGNSGYVLPQDTLHQLQLQGEFSIFCISPGKVQMTGAVKYPLTTLTHLPSLSSKGLSNKASGAVKITTETPLFLLKSHAVLIGVPKDTSR